MPKPLVLDPTTSSVRELASGDLVLPAVPTTALAAATKGYVDTFPQSMGLKNYIINPKLFGWQSGTSITYGPSPNAFGWGADRFLFQAFIGATGSGNNTITMTQQTFTLGQTDVPTNPTWFARIQASALGTQASGAMIRVLQYVEDVRTMQGVITISFCAKADSVRTIVVACLQNFGTGGSTAVYTSATVVLSAGTSWQRYSVTLTLPSIAGATIGANSYTTVELRLHSADPAVATTPNNWSTSAFLDFWGLTAEDGSVMTAFENRSQYLEDLMIRRYVTTSKNALVGRAGSATDVRFYNDFEVPMRVVPTMIMRTTTVAFEVIQTGFYTMTSAVGSISLSSSRRVAIGLAGTISPTLAAGSLLQLNQEAVAIFRAEY